MKISKFIPLWAVYSNLIITLTIVLGIIVLGIILLRKKHNILDSVETDILENSDEVSSVPDSPQQILINNLHVVIKDSDRGELPREYTEPSAYFDKQYCQKELNTDYIIDAKVNKPEKEPRQLALEDDSEEENIQGKHKNNKSSKFISKLFPQSGISTLLVMFTSSILFLGNQVLKTGGLIKFNFAKLIDIVITKNTSEQRDKV